MSLVLDYKKKGISGETFSCFVIMPFNEKRNIVYQSAIRPAIEKVGLKCIRADERHSPTPVLFDIYDAILSARVIIADISEPNANVYYELGIGHALKQHVLLISEKGMRLPFDISGIRHISYEVGKGGDEILKSALIQSLEFVLSEPSKQHSESRQTLEKGYGIWSKSPLGIPGEVTISQEQFIEIVFLWDEIEVSEKEAAFLAHTAAYFGKLMSSVVKRIRENKHAISGLIVEAAAGTTIRVPWRAAAMLEHVDYNLLKKECHAYSNSVRNVDLFPTAILEYNTHKSLSNKIASGDLDEASISKLTYVLKQIEAEFIIKAPAYNEANSADAKKPPG